jgi:hypothetical protein
MFMGGARPTDSQMDRTGNRAHRKPLMAPQCFCLPPPAEQIVEVRCIYFASFSSPQVSIAAP